MFKKALVISLPVAGLIIGYLGGVKWYEHSAGDYAQYGYEFEGMLEVLVGAIVGLAAGVAAAYVFFVKNKNNLNT
jgi:hypothetical protein